VPNFQLEDWVQDIQELLSHLQVDRFHILGTSFRSIHAAGLASLYEPQQAVGNVELYVAMAPLEANEHDPLQGSVLDIFGRLRRFPLVKRLVEKLIFLPLLLWFTPPDSDVHRSVSTQWEGCSSCADIIYQPWKFDWHKMAESRRVVIVSGRQDNVAPPHNQRRLHNQIVGSQLVEYDGNHDRGIIEPQMMIEHLKLIL